MLCVGLDPDPARSRRRSTAPATPSCGSAPRSSTPPPTSSARSSRSSPTSPSQRAEPAARSGLHATSASAIPDVVLVLDAKRGDIGSTAEHYAREAFGRYGADAVTVNPYLGTDAAAPFLEHGGVLALCRTSNPGSADLQDLDVGGRPLYQRVARMVAAQWAALGDCGLVVGATQPPRTGRRPRHRRRPADPRARRRRPGRRPRGVGAGRRRPARAPACSSARPATILYASPRRRLRRGRPGDGRSPPATPSAPSGGWLSPSSRRR